MNKTREYLNKNQVVEALRLFVVNDLRNTNTYDHLFTPMLEGKPAVIAVTLKKRRLIRVTKAETFEDKYEEAVADLKEQQTVNKNLKKDVADVEKALAEATKALKEQKEKVKSLETKHKKAKEDTPSEDSVSGSS